MRANSNGLIDWRLLFVLARDCALHRFLPLSALKGVRRHISVHQDTGRRQVDFGILRSQKYVMIHRLRESYRQQSVSI